MPFQRLQPSSSGRSWRLNGGHPSTIQNVEASVLDARDMTGNARRTTSAEMDGPPMMKAAIEAVEGVLRGCSMSRALASLIVASAFLVRCH
jgi:hypothetical protein